MATMLTTIDNPFDPFTQYDEWYAFDEGKGYHTCSYLARIAITSDNLPDSETEMTIESAINEIVKFNISGIYKKVTDGKS